MGEKRSLSDKQISSATQKYLDIGEIRDDLVIMKDGTLRAVLMVSSLNFSLKSEEEQASIVSQYISFLNSLEFPVQIVVQSRQLNIDGYLANLRRLEKQQVNELLKLQTAEYIQYVSELISIGKIMSKHFYLIIPYNPLSDHHKTFMESFGEIFRPSVLIKIQDKRFLEMKEAINRRIDKVLSGLAAMSLNAAPLDTQSLIELFYNTYNPTTAANQKMANSSQLRIEN